MPRLFALSAIIVFAVEKSAKCNSRCLKRNASKIAQQVPWISCITGDQR